KTTARVIWGGYLGRSYEEKLLISISGDPGSSITLTFSYNSYYTNHVKYCCKGYFWLFCSTVARTDTQDSSSRFSVSDDKIQKTLTVKMNNLMETDTSYYWCAVEIDYWSNITKKT
uniref:Immunoglobulin V-set domain-containing protein n=1 Tax=Monopterus albus TaxID=43700 RepID=A0A3Q3IZZ7_MONAL